MPLCAPQPFQALTHLHMSCESLSLFSSLLHSISGTNSGTSGCPNLKKFYNIALHCGPTGIWSELLTILTRIKLEHISIIEKCNSEPHPCYTGPTFFELHPFLARPTALVNIKTLLIFPVSRYDFYMYLTFSFTYTITPLSMRHTRSLLILRLNQCINSSPRRTIFLSLSIQD
ncbi:hypothetical protein EV424DRAFT_6518 [Suillus variegatus]|nr:hypothetical protein EV424DRAFT_6518 [Suillus variegatus]